MRRLRMSIFLATTLVACGGSVATPGNTGAGGSGGSTAAVTTSSAASTSSSSAGTTSTGTGAGVCVVGQDQTCNDVASASAIWGTCQPDATCTCNPGFEVSPSTGLCHPASDAGAYACGDQTCAANEFCVERVHAQDAGPVPSTWQCQLYFACTDHTCACALQSFVSASCVSPTCQSESPVVLRCDDLN